MTNIGWFHQKNKLFGGVSLKMEKEIATLMAVTLASVPREGS